MKVINQVVYTVLALVWLAIAVMYAVKENDKEMAFLTFIISLQYQNMLYQRDNREKTEETA